MSQLHVIKRKIESLQNTRQTTKVMQMDASIKLNRMKQAANKLQNYKNELGRVVVLTGAAKIQEASTILLAKEPKRIALVLITSERGLCGSYNADILTLGRQRAMKLKQKYPDVEIEYIIAGDIGLRMAQKYMKNPYNAFNFEDVPTLQQMSRMAQYLLDSYKNQEFDYVELCVQKLFSGGMSKATIEELCPFNFSKAFGQLNSLEEQLPLGENIITEPEKEGVIEIVKEKYFSFCFYDYICQAKIGEHIARMRAMVAATKNAEKLLEQMNRRYSLERKSRITQEILELVSGSKNYNLKNS